MKPAKLTAMLIAIAVFYSAAADADEINCTYIVTHVHSYIVKPRRSGMSQQAVLARIAGSDLSALEKRWLNEFTRVAYPYEKKIGGIPIMSWAEHNCIKKRRIQVSRWTWHYRGKSTESSLSDVVSLGTLPVRRRW